MASRSGHWDLPQDQADQLRDYLLRGGFLMVDDFHADQEWATFLDSLERVLPDRPVVDLPNNDPIFHTIYDLDDRVQIPGAQYLQTGRIYEKDESGKAANTGARCTTTRAASSSPSATTWTWATPGNGPTIRAIRKSGPAWPTASR